MRTAIRRGKTNPIMIAVVPPLIFVVGLMVYNAFKFFVPSAFSVENAQRVEAIEVMDGVSPKTDNGLIIPQPQSLRAGGSSRLVVSRPNKKGDFVLITGEVSAGFLADKIPLDKMLHIKFDSSSIRVESDGEPVEAVLMFPRTETKPLRVDMPGLQPEQTIDDILFANPSLEPVPPGTISSGKFVSENGMSVETDFGLGQSGTLNFGDVAQLNFKLDAKSSAWVEMPRSVRVQHKAVGTENVALGILVVSDKGEKKPFDVFMFGEKVAEVPRR